MSVSRKRSDISLEGLIVVGYRPVKEGELYWDSGHVVEAIVPRPHRLVLCLSHGNTPARVWSQAEKATSPISDLPKLDVLDLEYQGPSKPRYEPL